MLLRLPLIAILLALVALSPAFAQDEAAAELVWTYERWVGDNKIDTGRVALERAGYAYCVRPSKAGGFLRIAAVGPDYSGTAELPNFAADLPRYGAGVFEQGRFVAVRHSPGERWVIGLGERSFELTEPYTQNTYELRGTVVAPGEQPRDWNVKARGGGWFVSGNPSSPSFLYGPPGAILDELSPELRAREWIAVELPAGHGTFLGSAAVRGVKWSVDIDGRQFTGTAPEPVGTGE